ncbi:MAG: oligosaccharide flippase family protein [Bryobacteraceae bacterium]
MPLPESAAPNLAQQVAGAIKTYLRPRALKSLFTRTSLDRGRERYRRAGMTASTSFVAKALTIMISFVSVPLTMHYLGAERYGVWLTISSLLVWMSMTDFGLAGNALVNVLAEAHGKEDQESARHYTASAFWALVTIAVSLGAIFLAAFHAIAWRTVFRVSAATSNHELLLTCALVLTFFVINVPLSLLPSVYNGYQDGFMWNVWSIITNLVALISLIVVTRFHGGLPQLVIALSGTRVMVGLANAHHAFFRRYRWLAPWPTAVRWTCVRRLVKLGGKYMVTQIAGLGIYQSQPMIITQMLGPAQVMVFVVAQKIITLPVDLAYMATVPFISAFGEAKARDDWGWIKVAYKRATTACIGFGIPVMLVIAVSCKFLIRIWAGPAAVPDWPLIAWLCIYTFVGVALMTAGQLLCGLERVDALAISIVLCAIGCVALGILFSRWWGLGGVALAMAISKIVTYWPIQLYEVRRIFRMSDTPVQTVEPQCVG